MGTAKINSREKRLHYLNVSVRKHTLKGGLLLGGAQVISQASSFLRNVIVARFVSPADFGIAAVFAMTLNFLDLLNMSYDKLLIQAKDGDNEQFQSTVQWMLLLRGVFTGLLVLVCAGLVSRLFGVPHARWAFYCLALVPLGGGLLHLDMCRVQREMDYAPATKVNLATNILTLVIAFPLAYLMRDYRAMLWIIVAKVVINVVLSHLIAERSYSLAWYGKYVRRAFSFGWPLLLNGFLVFGILQGDQFVIGSANRLFHRSVYSLSDLGVYSVAFLLTMVPTVIVANITSSLFLPLFARVAGTTAELERRYAICGQALALISVVVAIPFIFCGGSMVSRIYGDAYSGVSTFIGWLAAMQALRMLRVGPNQAALARSDTKNTMLANTARSVALIASLCVAWAGWPLKWIAVGGVVGEVIALVVSVALLSWQHQISALLALRPAGIVAAMLAIALMITAELNASTLVVRIYLTLLLELVTVAVMLGMFPRLRQATMNALNDLVHWADNIRTGGLKVLFNS